MNTRFRSQALAGQVRDHISPLVARKWRHYEWLDHRFDGDAHRRSGWRLAQPVQKAEHPRREHPEPEGVLGAEHETPGRRHRRPADQGQAGGDPET